MEGHLTENSEECINAPSHFYLAPRLAFIHIFLWIISLGGYISYSVAWIGSRQFKCSLSSCNKLHNSYDCSMRVLIDQNFPCNIVISMVWC